MINDIQKAAKAYINQAICREQDVNIDLDKIRTKSLLKLHVRKFDNDHNHAYCLPTVILCSSCTAYKDRYIPIKYNMHVNPTR